MNRINKYELIGWMKIVLLCLAYVGVLYFSMVSAAQAQLYVMDTYNHRLMYRNASDLSYVDKIGSEGSGNDNFEYPMGITTDGTYLYILDTYNDRIVKRLASDLSYVSKIGSSGTGNDQFNQPHGITTDGIYLYVADTGNDRIVKRLASDLSYVSKIGSSGTGNDQFNQPHGITTDGTYLYVGDILNHRIVKRLTSDLSYVSKIDVGAEYPISLTNNGNYLYMTDDDYNRIEKRLASDLSYVDEIGSYGSGDDEFDSPSGITTDGIYLYVADTNNHRIVKRLASNLNYIDEIGTQGSGDDNFEYPMGIGIFVEDDTGYTISGYVTVSKTGTYLSNTRVNTTTVDDYTDDAGFYELTGLDDGTYTVHAYNFNYQPQDVNVIISGTDVTQNITLDSWVFPPATSNITVLDEAGYAEFHAALVEFNYSRSMYAMAAPFVGVLGNFFFLILFGMPFLMAWIRQANVIIPVTFGFTIGGIMLGFLPVEYQGTAIVFLILAFVGVMYGVFKERF